MTKIITSNKILFLLFLTSICLIGCSLKEKTIEIPTFSTIDEYINWGNKNNITIKFIDENREIVDIQTEHIIYEVPIGNISSGDSLEIIVSKKNNNSKTQIIFENAPYWMNNQ